MSVRVRRIGNKRRYTIACHGLSKDELYGLYVAFREEIPGSRPAFRNPSPPEFDPQAVYQLIVHMVDSVALAYVGKKLVDKGADILANIIERKLSERESPAKKKVVIYGPNDEPLLEVAVKPEKPKKKR